ncbi:hypothetical protein C2S51_019140 [Perilla frutescens var. frutescens]|nr:hypothetical protein C2S51_019140 [Perilla frutescens var. frutescens]
MDFSPFYSISFLTFLFLIFLSKFISGSKNAAPGPPRLPVIGHLHLLNKQPLYKTFQQFAQKYGPTISLKFGFRDTLVVSSPAAVQEIFTRNDLNFSNRPKFLSGRLLNYNFTTLGAAPYGPLWRNLRRLTTTEIFSTARLNTFLSIRQEEIKLLIKDLYRINSISGKDFARVEMKSKLSELSFNIIMRIVAEKRYFGDQVQSIEESRCFRDLIREMSYLNGASNPGDFLPFLQWIDYQGVAKRMRILQRKMDSFLQGLIDEHRENVDDNDAARKTMIHSILALQQAEPEDYSDEIIKGIILILLMAGTDTTAVTMEWAISLLLNHPEVLSKAKSELDHYVGRGRLVDEPDISNLTYLQGIVNETLRLYPAVPLLAPRESSDDCTIGGFEVAGKTMLLVNAWAIHRDPQLWQEPERFKPERYEGMEEDSYRFKLIPFGLGRRKCPGAGLANREVTLALAALIQCFEWERVDEELVDIAEGAGLSMPKEKPLEAMCRARQEMVQVIFNL